MPMPDTKSLRTSRGRRASICRCWGSEHAAGLRHGGCDSLARLQGRVGVGAPHTRCLGLPMTYDLLLENCNAATMTAGAPYGAIEDAAIAITGDKIAWVGLRKDAGVAKERI